MTNHTSRRLRNTVDDRHGVSSGDWHSMHSLPKIHLTRRQGSEGVGRSIVGGVALVFCLFYRADPPAITRPANQES
jgi:hypothetical protein